MPRRSTLFTLAALLLAAAAGHAQVIDQSLGADPRVDYPSLNRFGPWDDRNYLLTAADLELLADNEHELMEAIPAFYRVELRRALPDMRREGEVQYPRSALPKFMILYGGYLYENRLYRNLERRDGRWLLALDDAVDPPPGTRGPGEPAEPGEHGMGNNRFLDGEAKVNGPHGAAESAIAINPLDNDIVIAGSNCTTSGCGGQKMYYSDDGGATWNAAAELPLGLTCCDPTVAWSSDATKAYTATLSFTSPGVYIYRSSDDGQTWNDFEADTPGDPRREIGTSASDKEYIHVDTFPTSPHLDNIYLTWHESNVLRFSRSTDFGDTWSTPISISVAGQTGIGSDIATDKSGNIYYFWPAVPGTGLKGGEIFVRKSINGGTSFQTAVKIADTEGGFIFPLPSTEFRQVFIYVSADVDLTDGPYANRIYAAWTDNTGPDDPTPANNHARIQVAYSSDGGATWTVTTPHETADANTVDRWHQWLAVGPDGTVHVVFYDTRQNPSRNDVDFYHSMSTDGGATWTAPARLTTVSSPDNNNNFEFGDYNGLDVQAGGFLSIFTDTRMEDGSEALDDVYAAGAPLAEADLAVTKDDGVTESQPGDTEVYTIVVTNNGPTDVAGATVTDSFPSELTCSWTCAPAGGASCTAGPVAGDIADLVTIPNGDSVTYTATCESDRYATGTIVNTASVTSPIADPTPGNDSDDDSTTLVIPPCGLPNDDLVLSNTTVNTTGNAEEACISISAGDAYVIDSGGGMSFRARERILLRNGFSVVTGGFFSGEIDPVLGGV